MKRIAFALGLGLGLGLVPAFAARAQEAQPEPLDALFEKAVERNDDAAIEAMFKQRPYEVIFLVDGYLEGWLSNVEGRATGKDKVADPKILLDRALDAAARADKTLGGDGYTKYAAAWKSWSPEQQKRFRKGQEEFHAGAALHKEKNYDDAKVRYEASLRLAAPLGDVWGEAQAQQALGGIAFGKGDLEAARAAHERAVALWTAIRQPHGMRKSLDALAAIHEKQGDLKKALDYRKQEYDLGVAMARPKEILDRGRLELARLSRALGDEEAAKKWEAEAKAEGPAKKQDG